MKTFDMTIREALRKGLRNSEDANPGSETLFSCYNLKANLYGLVDIDVPTFPITGATQGGTWPLDQIIEGESAYLFIKYSDGYYVYSLNSNWAASALAFKSASLDSGDDVALTYAPKQFHGFESAGVWVLTNSNSLITNSDLFTSDWVQGTAITVQSICLHDGRGIYAGLTKSGVYAFWDTAWQTWMSYKQGLGDVTNYSTVANTATILYGCPAGGDVDIPFSLELALLCNKGISTIGDLILDAIRSGSMGFVRNQFPGAVVCVKPLGNRVIVYGQQGISMMIPTDSGYAIRKLINVGVTNSNYVAGDGNRHVFVDREGYVWDIQNEYVPRRLGYREYFSDNNGAIGLVLCLDQPEQDVYITSSTKSYILTRSGLTQAAYRPTSLVSVANKLYGTFATPASTTVELVAGYANMNRNGIKKILCMEIEQEGLSAISAAVDYRYNSGDSYVRSTAIPINREEAAYPIVCGTELRPVVVATPSTSAVLSAIRVRWQGTDLRTIKGLVEQSSAIQNAQD